MSFFDYSFDKYKNFQNYFTHNNYSTVIENLEKNYIRFKNEKLFKKCF